MWWWREVDLKDVCGLNALIHGLGAVDVVVVPYPRLNSQTGI